MKRVVLIAALMLAGCGADGEPVPHGSDASGEARIGVVGGI